MRKMILALILCFMLTPLVLAGTSRTNVFQTYIEPIPAGVTVNLPSPSRDIYILNGASDKAVVVNINLKGTSITGCNAGADVCFKLAGGDSIFFQDFITSNITFAGESHTFKAASPISLIATY